MEMSREHPENKSPDLSPKIDANALKIQFPCV